MALIAAKRIAVAAMSVQQSERAVAQALKDVLARVETAAQRAGRTQPVSPCVLIAAPDAACLCSV